MAAAAKARAAVSVLTATKSTITPPASIVVAEISTSRLLRTPAGNGR
jgi:hypothetical protein